MINHESFFLRDINIISKVKVLDKNNLTQYLKKVLNI